MVLTLPGRVVVGMAVLRVVTYLSRIWFKNENASSRSGSCRLFSSGLQGPLHKYSVVEATHPSKHAKTGLGSCSAFAIESGVLQLISFGLPLSGLFLVLGRGRKDAGPVATELTITGNPEKP